MTVPNFGTASAVISRCVFGLSISLVLAPAAAIARQDTPPGIGNAAKQAANVPERPSHLGEDRTQALFRRALRDAEAVGNVENRAHAFMEIASAQARTGDREAARQTYRRAIELGVTVSWDDSRRTPHVLQEIAYYQGEAGFRDEGVDTARKLLRIAEAGVVREFNKVDFYVNLVSVQASLHDDAGIRETIRLGQSFFKTSRNRDVRNHAPRCLVDMQLKSGNLSGALRMAHDPEFSQGGDAESFRRSSVLSILAHIRPGDDAAAAPVLAEARLDVEAERKMGRWAGMEELGWIAQAEAALGRFAMAMKTARSMDVEHYPDGYRLTMKADFIDGLKFKKASVLAAVAWRRVSAGDRHGAKEAAGEAVQIVSTIGQEDHKDLPLGEAVEALAWAGDRAGAIRAVDLIEPDRRAQLFEMIVSALRSSGDEAGAREAITAALALAQKPLDNLTPPTDPEKAREFNLIKDGHLRQIGHFKAMAGDTDGAIATVRRINDPEQRRTALAQLASDRAAVNDVDGALKVVDSIDSTKTKAEAVAAVVRALPARRASGPDSGAKSPQ